MKDKHTLVKNDGQVFTPDYLVRNILDFAGYCGSEILGKHVIDNSCGAGAFLVEVVLRYCNEAVQAGYTKDLIKTDLEKFVHGIELEDSAFEQLIHNLDAAAQKSSIENVRWNVIHGDALTVTEFDEKMDFVVGNPPYVRVHNLNDSYETVKSFSFAEGGMTDLYLVFYELGFRMLRPQGKLCYIAPSSWLSSLAGSDLRRYIRKNRNLVGVIDLAHYQPFDATAYTLIALFQKGMVSDSFAYYSYDGEAKQKCFISDLTFQEVDIMGNFYLASHDTLAELRFIKTSHVPKRSSVKNGFATLADKVFIGDVPETSITIPVIKASTGKWYRGLFPYDENGIPISEKVLFSDPVIKEYFENNKGVLTKGKDVAEGWMYYGRTQALKDVSKTKYAINTIVKDKDSIKLNLVPGGSGVYSGLYILTDVPEQILREILISDEFIRYISSLKNYKSGGYYTFNSKDLEQYLNFKINNHEDISDFLPIDKPRVSEGYLELF